MQQKMEKGHSRCGKVQNTLLHSRKLSKVNSIVENVEMSLLG